MEFTLEKRTLDFAQKAIDAVKLLPITSLTKNIIEQFISSSSSIGANYCEATEAESTSDFIHKIGICKKEAKETKYWIQLLIHTYPNRTTVFQRLDQEVTELILIFSATIKTARQKLNK